MQDVSASRLAAYCIACLVLYLALVSCARGPDKTYQGYLGEPLTKKEVATLRLGDADWVEVEEKADPTNSLYVKRGDYGEIELKPGQYRIRWGHLFWFSIMVNPAGMAEYRETATVSLTVEHMYTLRADRTTGPGYRIFFWIDDDTTGSVLHGVRKP